MSRSRWILATAVVASAALVGCAHCDTCDNFPAPCVGGDCGAPPLAPTMGGPVMMGGPALMGDPAPVLSSQPMGQLAPAGNDAAPLPPAPGNTTPPFSPPAPSSPSSSLPAPLTR